MKIEEAIKKAIEQGYDVSGFLPGFPDRKIQPAKLLVFIMSRKSDIFLDPLFWQALGKSLGWGRNIDGSKEQPFGNFKQWKLEWHYFIDFLAEGKTAEQYFETL